ncbi:ubiquitin family protein [Cyclospora cayetanensis]|uniref:Ubiquitin family protein n=1 Tax=Cyclospora cayetanensis TaxID=88456 RepID=A0A1D3D9Z9_9EIME|nr:ubiquitin family protein [Cyclospora cayetanensis]
MQILVKTLTGRRQSFNFEGENLVVHVKQALQEKEGVDVEQIRLIFSGKQMNDELKLSDYRVSPGCTIHMVLQLRGGQSH